LDFHPKLATFNPFYCSLCSLCPLWLKKIKNPNLLRRKLGSFQKQALPPFPSKGLRYKSKPGRFPGLRLPTPHAFPDWLVPSPVAEKSFQRSAFSKKFFTDRRLLTADCLFSCGFRSDHSCGAAVASHHLPSLPALFQKT